MRNSDITMHQRLSGGYATMRRILLVVHISLFALIGAQALCDTASEVLYTDGFETRGESATLVTGWHFFAKPNAKLVTEPVHSGNYAVCIEDDDPENAVGLRSDHLPIKAGEQYYVSWWFLGPKGSSITFYVEYWTATGERPVDSAITWGCNGRDKWEKFTRRFTVPEGVASITLHLNSYSTNLATGYFDDIEFGIGGKAVYDRTPQPPAPVKHPCGYIGAPQLEIARRNLKRHDWAKSVVDGWKSQAKYWMDMPDEKLPEYIPELTPYRAVDCPNCQAGSDYCWAYEPDKLKCKNCGFEWPNADFPEEYSDTVIDPTGKPQVIPYYKGKEWLMHTVIPTDKYRLSARLAYQRIGMIQRLSALGKLYAFTDDASYAEKVRAVLLRLAEVYPHYIPHDWYRTYDDYGNLQSGKMCGWKLFDAAIFVELATAYDLTYNSGLYSDEDKVKIEEGCFREFKRLMTETSPRGCCTNDGPQAMGAGALVGKILGDHEFIAWAIEPPDGFIGFVEDYFARDGHWIEASPSYEAMALGPIWQTPESLRDYSDPESYTGKDRYDNLDLLKHPLMRKMLVAGAYVTMPDGHMPATNDSTFTDSYPTARTEQNYFWNPTERNKALMAWAFNGDIGDSGSEYALFRRDPDLSLDDVEPWNPAEKSVVRPGVGWSILRTGSSKEDAALFMDFGPKGSGHGHADRLNIAYWDYGKEMVTDLGYLGWPHPNRPWMITTCAHNEVIVDGQPQKAGAGILEAFCGNGPVMASVASAPAAYDGVTSTYRRSCVMVNRGPGKRYLVDLFDVVGGSDHQYCFHADGETFIPPALDYSEIDAATLGDTVTGYGWLKEGKASKTNGAITCEWITDPETHFGTRLHMMQSEGTELVYAKTLGLRDRSNPFGKMDLYKTFMRRPGPENHFLSVIECFKGASQLTGVRKLTATCENGHAEALEVKYADVTDIVVIANPEAAETAVKIEEYPELKFTGRDAVVSLERDEPVLLWMLGGSALEYGELRITGEPVYTGTITAIEQETFAVVIESELPAGEAWAGQQMQIGNTYDGVYEMRAVVNENGRTVVTLADEPLITCKEGDTFRIVPAVSMLSAR